MDPGMLFPSSPYVNFSSLSVKVKRTLNLLGEKYSAVPYRGEARSVKNVESL